MVLSVQHYNVHESMACVFSILIFLFYETEIITLCCIKIIIHCAHLPSFAFREYLLPPKKTLLCEIRAETKLKENRQIYCLKSLRV